MSMEFKNGDYTFISQYGKVADAQTRKQMDRDEDGKISEEEKNLFYEDYYETRKSELANFKTNNPDKELGFEFKMLDVNKDGFLDEDEQKMMDELLKMSDIADEFIQKNEQYKIGNFGGVVADVKAFFENYVKGGLKANGEESLSETFKAALNKELSASTLSKNVVDDLSNRDAKAANTDLNRTISSVKKDGITTEETKELKEQTVELLMNRALSGASVEDILKGLINGVANSSAKENLVNLATQLQELVGQKLFKTPEAFLEEVKSLATKMTDLLSGTQLADGFTDNRSDAIAQKYDNQKINAEFTCMPMLQYAGWKGGFSPVASYKMVPKAIVEKDKEAIDFLAKQITNWYNDKGAKNVELETVKMVLGALPKDTNYEAFIGKWGDIDMNDFAKVYNETLDKLKSAEINAQDIDFAYDENLQIKDGSVNEEDAFYNQKTNETTIKSTLNGMKAQVKMLAETNYLLKGIEFNNDLFDKVYESVTSDIVSGGEFESLNSVLFGFMEQFNAQWVPESLCDIAAKEKE